MHRGTDLEADLSSLAPIVECEQLIYRGLVTSEPEGLQCLPKVLQRNLRTFLSTGKDVDG